MRVGDGKREMKRTGKNLIFAILCSFWLAESRERFANSFLRLPTFCGTTELLWQVRSLTAARIGY